MHIDTSDQPIADLGFYGHTCNWGAHICGLYHSEAERDDIVMGFLRAGDEAGDLQLYCPVDRTPRDFETEWDHRYPAACGHVHDQDRFQVMDVAALYFPDGRFSPRAMDRNLQAFFHESQAIRPRNVRATAEMVWALKKVEGVEHLMAYEARLNYFIPGKPWISICLYDLNRFDGATIMNVLRTHPYSLSGGVIMANPYYQDPTIWLRDNAPQFLD